MVDFFYLFDKTLCWDEYVHVHYIHSLSRHLVLHFVAIVSVTSGAYSQATSNNQNTVESFKANAWDISQRGTALDLAHYKQTFRDDFDALSVTPNGGKGPWYAPVHTPFGVGKFLPPGPNGPFTVKDGVLTITAEKVGEQWTTSSMQTVDGNGQGFAQQYGYFEARMKLPPGHGAWPAFWLLSQNGYLDKTATRTEIDVFEWYNGDPKGLHITAHLWPAAVRGEGYPLKKHVHLGHYYNFNRANPPVLVDGQLEGFHNYGVEITPDWVIMYFDRSEVCRFKTQPEFKTPFYMLVTLALYEKEIKMAVSPITVEVDYVVAYQRE